MTPSKFDWLIHTMLFCHTKHVIKQQQSKGRKRETTKLNDNDSGSDDGVE